MSQYTRDACWGPDFPTDCAGVSSPVVRLVALAMGDVVNDMHDWLFFGSAERLAAKCGVHRDTVRKVIRHLEAHHVIRTFKIVSGRPTEYQWIYDPAATPRGQDTATPRDRRDPPAATPRGTPRQDSARTEEQQNCEQKSVATATGAAASQPALDMGLDAPLPLTINQRAKTLSDAFWTWHKRETGREPAGITWIVFRGLMEPLLKAGRTEREIGAAVKALWLEGRTLSKQTIAAEIDGRRPRRGGRTDVAAGLAGMQFDADGMLVANP